MRIEELIPTGAENAVTRGTLRVMAGMTDRQMRRAIAAARERGVLICNAQDGRGYYMPETEAERDAFLRQEHARVRSMFGWLIACEGGGTNDTLAD